VSVEIIDVKIENQLLDLSLRFQADWAVVHIRVVGSVTVELAVVLLVCVQNSLGYNLEIVKGLWKRRGGINIPIRATISDHHTSEIYIIQFWLKLGLHVVLVNLPSQIWNIDAGVTFSRHEEFIW
jgi:hypothetical protein